MVTQPSATSQNCSNSFHSIGKDDIPGFEDVEDSDGDGLSIEAQGHEEEEATNSQANSNSNLGKVVESPSSNDSRQHTTSRTRTKTVSFSQNGYSEEICKVNQHLRALGEDVSNDEVSQASQPPPGFEKHVIDHTNGDSTPIQNDNDLAPANYKEALLQGISPPASPASTPESLVRLAHDSLQIGELLGVKVIGNLDAAIPRITEPLKKSRAKARSFTKERSAH